MTEIITKHKMKTLAAFLIAVSVLIITFCLVAGVFSNNSIYTSTNERNISVNTLSCTSESSANAFFNTSNTNKVEQKIKVIFSDDKPNEIMYTLNGIYATKESANNEGGSWRMDYDIYMRENGSSSNIIKNTFAVADTKAWANLYANLKNINSVTAKVFLLTPEEYADFHNYNISTMAKIYNGKGFHCEIIERK